MDTFIQVIWTNSLLATVLAAVVFCVGRFIKSPTLTHALWLLVLLKFITPPILPLPAPPSSIEWVKDAPQLALSETVLVTRTSTTEQLSPASNRILDVTSQPNLLCFAVVVVWVSGSVIFLCVQLLQIMAFRKFLKTATAAPASIQEQVHRLALCMGLQNVPQVLVVKDQVSPMLWAFGLRVKLIVPADLMDRMSAKTRETVLAHEVSHYVRGDHWVRILEMIVMAIFWWHPVAWWAKRHLQDAEEECCDARVVAQMPGMGRTYAQAILETIQYLSEDPQPLPPAASGMSRVGAIKRRLQLILQGRVPASLSERARLLVIAFACAFLPVGEAVSFGSKLLEAPNFYERSSHYTENSSVQVSAPTYVTNSQRRRAYSITGTHAVQVSEAGVHLENLKTRSKYPLLDHAPTTFAFSADEQLVLAAVDRTARVWRVSDGALRGTVRGFKTPICSVAFGPASDRLALASADGMIAVCDTQTCQPISTFRIPDTLHQVRFATTGTHLLTVTTDPSNPEASEVKLWGTKSRCLHAVLKCDSLEEALLQLDDGRWNEFAKQLTGKTISKE